MPLIGLFPLPEPVDLNEMIARLIVAFLSFLTLLEIRRENSVDHIELVLENAVLFLEDPDSIEQFFFRRHVSIVMY